MLQEWVGYWHSKYFQTGNYKFWVIVKIPALPNIWHWKIMNKLGILLGAIKEEEKKE